jgi:hypothetical protein
MASGGLGRLLLALLAAAAALAERHTRSAASILGALGASGGNQSASVWRIPLTNFKNVRLWPVHTSSRRAPH